MWTSSVNKWALRKVFGRFFFQKESMWNRILRKFPVFRNTSKVRIQLKTFTVSREEANKSQIKLILKQSLTRGNEKFFKHHRWETEARFGDHEYKICKTLISSLYFTLTTTNKIQKIWIWKEKRVKTIFDLVLNWPNWSWTTSQPSSMQLSTTDFPDALHCVKVLTNFEARNRSNYSNYWPISL